MKGRESFDDALDQAIDALDRGEPLESVLARYPRHAAELRPLLETMQHARAGATVATAMSPRLADQYTIVRAAVQRAQIAMQAQGASARAEPSRGGWWQRRVTFASVSLPVGAIALLALAGVSGAAASMAVAGETGVPSAVVDLVKGPTHWLPGGDDHRPGELPTQGAPAGGQATAGAPGTSSTDTPGDANRPTQATIEGTISDVRGDVFTLTTADGAYKVNIDGKTEVSGTIADGATATVTGDVTAEKNLHAETVTVTAAATPSSDEVPPGQERTPGPPADRTPPRPAAQPTPPGPPGERTPPGQSGTHTPPGQSGTPPGHAGGANGNGNGNGGGNGKKP